MGIGKAHMSIAYTTTTRKKENSGGQIVALG
jgi:hypothetical protein